MTFEEFKSACPAKADIPNGPCVCSLYHWDFSTPQKTFTDCAERYCPTWNSVKPFHDMRDWYLAKPPEDK